MGSDLGERAVGRICGTLFKGGLLVIWLATTQRRGEVGSDTLNGSSAVQPGVTLPARGCKGDHQPKS